MGDWKAALKSDPTDWLLEEENPSVRYFALKDICGLPEEDAAVQAARRAVMLSGAVCGILARLGEPACRLALPRFYTDKYEGLAWQLIVLAELGAEAGPQIRELCEYILEHSQERMDGGFSMHAAAREGGGRVSEVIPCLTGNMVWCLLRFGYLGDPRLQKGIDWLTRFMRFNDGAEDDPQVPPYNRYEMCWGRHTCHMGVVKALKALGAVPAGERTPEIDGTVGRAAEFMLAHRIHKHSSDPDRISKPGWLKFGFPLMYQTDALEILDILTGLGIRDGRMDEAAGIALSKQDETGRWRLENAYANDRLLMPMGRKGEPDKWITLRAMRVMKRLNG